eukprot:TRINITY_DN5056_c0_g1_i1.p1 TRINITY_DN5056_c0_g1~~TRINITY_DN5056_c0_g1_i1.p1  ORF type:complete len:370 (+),score=75.09 TRINITY_DN5056_c0_g1_i1:27-1112(+)
MKQTGTKTIGILTGGGDCPGLNAVIRAVVETAKNKYNVNSIGFVDGFEGLWTGEHVQLCCGDVSDILSTGGTILGTTNKGHYSIPIPENVIAKSIETYNKLGLSCLVCIGGDGTMSVADKLAKAGINCVGVPKTIDNDLRSTDLTFGFDSATSVATDALDRLHTTAASHHRVMVVEVMGRNAGWIALHSGVAGGAAVILLPEVNWKWEPVIKKIKDQVNAHRHHYCIICVAEGCKLPGGSQVGLTETESKRLRLGGIGNFVADKIAEATEFETRCTVLGHVQRGGSPTCYDRILATKYGSMAAKIACEGEYGKMVSLKGTQIVTVPITSEMEQQRLVDIDNDQLVWAARSTGVCFGDELCE